MTKPTTVVACPHVASGAAPAHMEITLSAAPELDDPNAPAPLRARMCRSCARDAVHALAALRVEGQSSSVSGTSTTSSG